MEYNKEKNRLLVSGALVKCTYGPLESFNAGKKKTSDKSYYQFALATDEDKNTAALIMSDYYAGKDSAFIPAWVKGTADKTEDGRIYVNFKSLYDIKYFLPGEETPLSYDDVREHYGSIVGSEVTASIVCKDGALYVGAIRVDKLKTVTVDDYFA